MDKSELPVFSIIIPVYNTEKELTRCIDSILKQTFDSYEIILVDDGSKDSSGAICDNYVAAHNNIKVIHQKNAGCSEARNTGVRNAAGRYLIFVDSDDGWVGSSELTEIAELCDSAPDIVVFGVKIYDSKGNFVKERRPTLRMDNKTDKESILSHLIARNEYFSTSYVKVLRKDFFISHNLFFVKGLLSEDIEWSARLMVLSKTIAIFPVSFYQRYNRDEGSITSCIGRKNVLDILSSIEKGVCFTAEEAESDNLLPVYYEYWAYQFAMLLGFLPILRKDADYAEICRRIKNLSWLLKYDHVKKVRIMRILYRVFGLQISSMILSLYYKH